MSPKKLKTFSAEKTALAQALESASRAHDIAICEAGGGLVCREPDFTLVLCPQAPRMNSLISPQFTEENAEARVEAVLALARDHGQEIGFKLGPSTQPADLGSRLQRRGLKKYVTFKYMGLDLSAGLPNFPVPAGARVYMVEEFDEFYEMPHPFYGRKGSLRKRFMYNAFEQLARSEPCRHWIFVVEKYGHFAGAGRMFLHGDIVVGYDFAILKSERRQGLGAALICQMGQFAIQQGACWAVLNTSTEGAKFYPHFGFAHLGGYPSYRYTRAMQQQDLKK